MACLHRDDRLAREPRSRPPSRAEGFSVSARCGGSREWAVSAVAQEDERRHDQPADAPTSASGRPESRVMSREEWRKEIGPFWEDATDEAVERGLAFVIPQRARAVASGETWTKTDEGVPPRGTAQSTVCDGRSAGLVLSAQ
jgi:hypothetical protein